MLRSLEKSVWRQGEPLPLLVILPLQEAVPPVRSEDLLDLDMPSLDDARGN